MKIVHVVPILGCGGAEILAGGVALQQKNLGCEVSIVTLKSFHETFDHYQGRDLLLKEIPIVVTPSRANIFRLQNPPGIEHWKSFLLQFKPDVIHTHLYEADFLAHSVILPHVAYITHLHGPMPELLRKKSLPSNKKQLIEQLERQWIRRRYIKSRTHFIAISRAMQDYAKTIVPIDLHDKIHLLNNAINIDSFPFVRRKISTPLQLVTVGNLLERKNHGFLIDVVAKLLNDGISCHLNILGYGPLERKLQDRIDSYHLNDHIHLKGSVGNVNEYLSRSHLYIHAAQPEPFGIAVLEAMATGLPVVTLDGGGTRDIVQDGINGFILKENDVSEFVKKIALLIGDQSLYELMSKEAALAASKFDIKKYALETERIYKAALAGL